MKGFASTLVVLTVIALAIVGGAFYYSLNKTTPSPTYINTTPSGTDVRFTGTIQEVTDHRPVDGDLQIEVNNKWISLGGGLRPLGNKTVTGSVIGLDEYHVQNNIGKRVNVFARQVGPQQLSLEGNSKYYIAVVQ